MHVCAGACGSQKRASEPSRAGVAGGCELLDVGSGTEFGLSAGAASSVNC